LRVAYCITNDQIFTLDGTMFGPRCWGTGLDVFRRLTLDLRVLLDTLQGDLSTTHEQHHTYNMQGD